MTRKIKHKTPKFFGYAKDAGARRGGRWGRRRSYGRNSPGNAGGRTPTEIRNSDQRREERQGGELDSTG